MHAAPPAAATLAVSATPIPRRVRRATAMCLVLTLLHMPGAALSGAWLREVGSTYLSFSFEAPQEGNGWSALYAERGVRPRLTLGLDAGRAAGRGDGQALVFGRIPLGPTDGASRRALELGLGVRLDEGAAPRPAARLGLSWGRGFDSRFGPGWVAIDSSLTGYSGGDDGLTAKIDVTVGVRPGEDSMTTLQVFWSRSGSDEAALRLVPSYARRLRGETFGQIGLVLGSGAAPELGVKIGLFTEF